MAKFGVFKLFAFNINFAIFLSKQLVKVSGLLPVYLMFNNSNKEAKYISPFELPRYDSTRLTIKSGEYSSMNLISLERLSPTTNTSSKGKFVLIAS